MIIVGEHLRTLRKTAGLTQGELALQVDVPLPRLIKLERDGGPISPFLRMRLAQAMGLAPKALERGDVATVHVGGPVGGVCPTCGQRMPGRGG